MGAELFRKYVTSSTIICYRSVVRHPFLVGMIIFLFSMYRLFPLLFSILVSTSPVLVSTAVLLGTLLSYGQPNIPEIEKEPEPEPESEQAEIQKLKSKVTIPTEETNGSRIEVADKSFDEFAKLNEDDSRIEDDAPVNLVDNGLREFGESRYSPLQQADDEHIVLESDKLWEGSADPLNSNSGLLWKGVERNGDDDDDDGSDSEESSGSDLAESSSPDASMADIIPMLDELHPLLSEEHEIHQLSRDDVGAVSEHSLESSDTSSESNDDTGIQNQENLRTGDDEDKESRHSDKEDETQSVITWTEYDQKNLMDLGTSEMERNQRLENLIARRRKFNDDTGNQIQEKLQTETGDDEDKDSEHSDKEDQTGDDEDKESKHSDKEDETRSAITWTEDDQKNLMNVGTSEMERNQQLENLIARRRKFNDDTGIQIQEDLKTGDDEYKESKHSDKEDETQSAITWTEYDQKNLMNLGTSEMERNRRLENLIARRRARKTMRMQAEKNLIDLESADDLPWNIPAISTTRTNPFDYDANDDIPGSAPSVMLQRRNPFDLPYDSSEEKPDLVGDTFQQEFAVFEPKEPSFRRFESFNVGLSERRESKLKPYFVPERSFSSFQRQFSGLSDSKVSSVPDTESVSSDVENKDHIEEDEHEVEHVAEVDEHVSDHVTHGRPYFVPEHVASDETNFSSFQRQLSEASDSKVSSETDTESVSSVDDVETKDHIELSVEPDLISIEDHEHASEHISLVQESFDDEAEITVGSVTSQQELHSSGSSLSSLDEVSEQIYNEKEDDDVAMEPPVSEAEYFLDRGSSIERSEAGVTSLLVEESHPNEPIYDLSPRSVTRNLSSSSISNDLHKDESFQHTDGHDQPSSSVSHVKWNSTESSSETVDAQNQLPAVPINEDHVLVVDDIPTSLANKPIEDAVLDLDASHELEQVQVSSSNSHAILDDSFHQEDVISQPDEESLLAENSIELQARDLEHGEVTLPRYDSQSIEVVHEYTYVNHGHTHEEDISQPQREFLLLDTSVNKPSEEHPEELQVQIANIDSDNLQIQEPDVAEVTDVEGKAQEIPAYASDTHSIEVNIDDADEIKEIDEDLLVELDAVGDFSVNSLNETKEDPRASENDLESKLIADEDPFNNDLESDLSEMNQYLHVSEHDLVNRRSLAEGSNFKDSGLTSSEIKQEYDIETKVSGDEDSGSKNVGTTLDERKQDSSVLDHDVQTMNSGDEDSCSKDLESTLDEIKQDLHASDLDLETKHSEETKQDPHDLDHDLETQQSEEMKHDPHDSAHDLDSKHSGDMNSYSKDLGSTLDEIKLDPHESDHDIETKHSEDEDSYSKDIGSTLDEMKQDSHLSDHDLKTKQSEDGDSYSKNIGSTLDEMKRDPHDSDLDLETKHSEDEDSYSVKDLDATFNEMKQGTHAMDHHHHLETFYSVDEKFYSRHVESTINEIKQGPHALDQDLEANSSGETEIKMDAEEGALQGETTKSKLPSGADEETRETESDISLANLASAETVSTSNTDKE